MIAAGFVEMEMEERRKIVIPTGVDPEETLAPRYFDTESTRAARPVVPLSDAPQGVAAVAPRSARRWLMPTIIAGVVIIGIGAGFAISVYALRQPPESPVAVRAVADKPRSILPWTHTPDEPAAEEDSTAAVADANEAAKPPQDIAKHAPEPQPRTGESDDKKRAREEAARDARDDQRDDQRDERVANERERRKQDRERRRNIGNQNKDDELPQDPINRRAQDGLHRVREIFEGTP